MSRDQGREESGQDWHPKETTDEAKSFEFTDEEEHWFEQGRQKSQERGDSERREAEEQIHDVREKIEALPDGEVPESGSTREHEAMEEDVPLATSSSDLSFGQRLTQGAKTVWQDTVYPTYERVAKSSFASMGLMSGSIGLGLAEAGGALQAGLAGGGLALGAFAVTEFALRRRREVAISPLMTLYKVFEKDSIGQRALAGEIHLSGKEALKRLRDIPLRDKRRMFLAETQHALQELQKKVQSGDKNLKNVQHFFGVTDVFSRTELEQLGATVTEKKENFLDKAFRYLGKKTLHVHTMGWKGMFRPMKKRPLYRIQFTRGQLENVAGSLEE